MRFGRALRKSQVHQWRKHYCDYDQLRQFIMKCESIRSAIEVGGRTNFATMALLGAVYEARDAELDFVTCLLHQTEIIEAFYRTQVNALSGRWTPLLEQAASILEHAGGHILEHARTVEPRAADLGRKAAAFESESVSLSCGGDAAVSRRMPMRRSGDQGDFQRAMSHSLRVMSPQGSAQSKSSEKNGPLFESKISRSTMRVAFVEVYRMGQMLETFCIVNTIAFQKILKKWRKRCPPPVRQLQLPTKRAACSDVAQCWTAQLL